MILSLTMFLSLASYNHSDPSFNLVTDNETENFLSEVGSYSSDLLYQLFGFSSFIFPICFASWAYFIFKNEYVSYRFLRNISMVITVCFASSYLSSFESKYLPAGSGGITGIVITNFITSLNFFDFMGGYLISIIYLFLAILFFVLALAIPLKIYVNIILKITQFSIFLVKSTRIITFLKNAILKIFSFDEEKTLHHNPNDTSFDQSSGFEKDVVTKKTKSTNISKSSKLKSEKNSLPPIDLLEGVNHTNVKPQTKAELLEKSDELLKVLQDFGVKGKIIDVREGPVVTMYEFEPEAGTKSSRVIGLADDIARSLSAISTRIAVIPGRNALGIELPNAKRMFFRLRELLETQEFNNPDIFLPIILGKDLSGRPLVADLAKMPHLLVAGTTGSGKSVAINAMIMSLLYRYTPDECKMIMIDPKMLELSAYDNIPHLMTPVVTEPGKAVVALKWAVKEMENRYRLMSHLGVRNIANYNARIEEANANGQTLERKIQTGFDPETGQPIYETIEIEKNKIPFIVVIVDEMADLMLVAGKDIESSIQRLAQMARAAGIHIIMATQRPSVDVITGVIKANFPSRISFKVISKIDSRTILGEQGSEQLLGMGDMLYMGNSAKILRVHGPFVDDKEVSKVTDFLRSNGTPEYVSAVTESVDEELSFEGNDSGKGVDDAYSKAVNIVKTERKASISYIQRSLRIGYNKAANIVEEMERNGILSSPNSSGKREILLPEN